MGLFSLGPCVEQQGPLLPRWCAFLITLIEFIIYLLYWTWLTLLPFCGGEKNILGPWGAARDADLGVQVLICPFKSHQAELIKMNDTKNCCKLSKANEITKTFNLHAALPPEVWWNWFELIDWLIESQINCSHIPSCWKPALCVFDSRIRHQRHSSYQLLDWGPGTTRVSQAILVLVKKLITIRQRKTRNTLKSNKWKICSSRLVKMHHSLISSRSWITESNHQSDALSQMRVDLASVDVNHSDEMKSDSMSAT